MTAICCQKVQLFCGNWERINSMPGLNPQTGPATSKHWIQAKHYALIYWNHCAIHLYLLFGISGITHTPHGPKHINWTTHRAEMPKTKSTSPSTAFYFVYGLDLEKGERSLCKWLLFKCTKYCAYAACAPNNYYHLQFVMCVLNSIFYSDTKVQMKFALPLQKYSWKFEMLMRAGFSLLANCSNSFHR